MNEKKFNRPFENLSKDIRINPQKSAENSDEKTKSAKDAENTEAEKRIIVKPKEYLKSVGIIDYTYEEKEDGAHFLIKVPSEHVRERVEQFKRLGALDPTLFEREKVLPFVKLLRNDRKLYVEVIQGGLTNIEVVVSKKK